jgi:hypothetical protein
MFCTPLLEGWKVVVGGHGSFGNLRFLSVAMSGLENLKGKGEKIFPLLIEHGYDL